MSGVYSWVLLGFCVTVLGFSWVCGSGESLPLLVSVRFCGRDEVREGQGGGCVCESDGDEAATRLPKAGGFGCGDRNGGLAEVGVIGSGGLLVVCAGNPEDTAGFKAAACGQGRHGGGERSGHQLVVEVRYRRPFRADLIGRREILRKGLDVPGVPLDGETGLFAHDNECAGVKDGTIGFDPRAVRFGVKDDDEIIAEKDRPAGMGERPCLLRLKGHAVCNIGGQ